MHKKSKYPFMKTKGSITEKATYLREQLDKKRVDWREGSDWITVDRSKILENSLSQIFSVDLHKVRIELLQEKTKK